MSDTNTSPTTPEQLRLEVGQILYDDDFVFGHDYDEGEIVIGKLVQLIQKKIEENDNAKGL